MMRVKINLITMGDAAKFAEICSSFDESYDIKVKDNKGNVVNAKSVMGMLYSLEFSEIWCESNKDIYSAIKRFAVE